MQFTRDRLPSDVLGSRVFVYQGASEFFFRQGPIFTDLLLADEITRAPPTTQSALLEAMHERPVSLEGRRRTTLALFSVIATQNPVDSDGTYPLPEAQLDRFLFKVVLPIPDRDPGARDRAAGTRPASTRATSRPPA